MNLKHYKIWGTIFLCLFCCLSTVFFSEAYDNKVSQSLSHYIMAGIYENHQDLDKALSEYRKAAQLDRSSGRIHSKMAIVYIKKSDFENATKELNLAIEYEPEAIENYFLLVLVYSSQGKEDLATQEYVKFLKLATKLYPHNIQLYKSLAETYLKQKNLEAAEKTCRFILGLSPKDGGLHFLLATIYEEQGNKKEAIEEFKLAIKFNPDDHLAFNALGYMYANEGINLDEAEAMIKKALEFEPDNGAYQDSLGWVYFKKGMIDLAIKELEKAVALLQDPVIYDHLGDAYNKKGLLRRAKENWQKSLELDSQQTKIKEKIEKNK